METVKDALHALFLSSEIKFPMRVCVDQGGNAPQNLTQAEDYKAALSGSSFSYFDALFMEENIGAAAPESLSLVFESW